MKDVTASGCHTPAMPHPSRRARPRRRLLLPLVAAPLLLLVPLGVLKWRADHPPVSKMDQQFRAAINPVPVIYIFGTGPTWRRLAALKELTGDETPALMIEDRLITRKLTQALRSTEQWVNRTPNFKDCIVIAWLPKTSLSHSHQSRERRFTGFGYWHDARGSYLTHWGNKGLEGRCAVVQPRFAPQFEALITRLAQGAKTLGQHPGLRVTNLP